MAKAEPSVTVKVADMDCKRTQEAQKLATDFLRFGEKSEMQLAQALKRHFDAAFGPKWLCVVGAEFGSDVTHRAGDFVFFFVGNLGILLFRAP
ncbi:hypothetical protein L596_018328 [Steinernema carpocapsae]|uniref:Dynein light chain n=1 Tax=Steinernema carpocapsae TaxID=34508 RepID=A0A4U5N532_STECR|nr:hypothetical protein L596_018328 [Steinernema carpocapsae]